MISTLGACEIKTIDHMPGEGNSTRPTRRRLDPEPENKRLEYLLEAAIDRPHHRHPSKQLFAEINQRPSDQIGGQEAQQRQRDHGDDQPGARQSERQIGFWPVGDGNKRPHQTVDPGYEPPGQIEGDRDRAGDDQTGEKIVAESGHEAPRHIRREFGRRQIVAVHQGSRSVEAAVIDVS